MWGELHPSLYGICLTLQSPLGGIWPGTRAHMFEVVAGSQQSHG